MNVAEEKTSVPGREAVLAGMCRVVQKVVENAKRDDAELIIADKNGKPVLIKARNL